LLCFTQAFALPLYAVVPLEVLVEERECRLP